MKTTRSIFTIPNLLTLTRILLIPVFIWSYALQKNDGLAIVIIALSALTDLLDGKIARRFNMVSDVGKLLDPIADKLTQGTLLICLLTRFHNMWVPLTLMIIKEAFVGITSVLAMQKSGRVEGAEFHGKVATTFLYALAIIHLLWGSIPSLLSNILIGLTTAVMLLSFGLYAKKNLGILLR